MEWREIEVFLTLADELHFGRTADRLYLSQAWVSQTVERWRAGSAVGCSSGPAGRFP